MRESYARIILRSWHCRFPRYIIPGYSYNEAPSFSYAIPWENLIQGLYSGLGTADSLAIISYQDILTIRLPAFLMQYHDRVIYPKLRTLRNMSSKVDIFTCFKTEISRAICFSIPNSLPAPVSRTGSTVVSTLRRDILHMEQKNLITRRSYVLYSTV